MFRPWFLSRGATNDDLCPRRGVIRRSATFPSSPAMFRGLKPTATVGCRSATGAVACPRDPKEPLFRFGRCVVHFAVDDSEVMMCTELNGKASSFLPFNQGCNDGDGNPPNPEGLKTAYLWQPVPLASNTTRGAFCPARQPAPWISRVVMRGRTQGRQPRTRGKSWYNHGLRSRHDT
ncbi:MAG: hypothetical protein WKF77_02365 [Planctomycetaceae bacterium]